MSEDEKNTDAAPPSARPPRRSGNTEVLANKEVLDFINAAPDLANAPSVEKKVEALKVAVEQPEGDAALTKRMTLYLSAQTKAALELIEKHTKWSMNSFVVAAIEKALPAELERVEKIRALMEE